MQFLNYDEIPADRVTQTFKSASWRGLFWVTVIMAAITAYTAIPKGHPTNPVIIAVPAAVTLLSALLMLWRLRQAWDRRNWLVKGTDEGLYINLQSDTAIPLVPDAPVVLFIPTTEITSVQRVQETRTLPQRSGKYRNHYSYFDLALREPLSEELLMALARIRRNPALRNGAGIRRDVHAPVRIHDRHTLRLVWDWMAPRELAAAEWFEARYPAEPFKKIKEPGWDRMKEAEREAYIDTLWEWGYVQDAVHLSAMMRTISERNAARRLADRLG